MIYCDRLPRWALSDQCGRCGSALLAEADDAQISSQANIAFSLLQLLTRSDPPVLSEGCGRVVVWLLAGADEQQIESQGAKSLPLFSLIAGGNPAGGNDVRSVSAVLAERRRPAVRARD